MADEKPNVSKYHITEYFILTPDDFYAFVGQGLEEISERKRGGLACDRFVISKSIYDDFRSIASRYPLVCPYPIKPLQDKKPDELDLFLGLPLIVDVTFQIGRASCRERVCPHV